MASKKKLLQAAAGSAGGAGLDVDEVFSTFLYTGTGSGQTFNNGIDLSGEGGLVWIKNRDTTDPNMLVDTERGASNGSSARTLQSNSSSSAFVYNDVTAFNSNGFTTGGSDQVSTSGEDFVSWTFRKAPKFFDVVTYSGQNTDLALSHNLGVAPGMVIVKRTDTSGDWYVYHRSLNLSENLSLNSIGDVGGNNFWTSSAPSSTVFNIDGNRAAINQSGGSYVAYLFAHNNSDGEFGPDADQDIIKCGSYTGNASTTGPIINLGFEPQWIMIKRTDSADNWYILDTMRGIVTSSGNDTYLYANLNSAEATVSEVLKVTATGFQLEDGFGGWNANGGNYAYMAIRRGPLAEPTSATDVFAIDGETDTSPTPPSYNSGFPVDLFLGRRNVSGADSWYVFDRHRGNTQGLITNTTDAEQNLGGSVYELDRNDGVGSYTGTIYPNAYAWMWKRAPSYFDAVAFTKTTSGAQNVSHNLGAVPEMMWIKVRNDTDNWTVYHKDLGNDKRLLLNSTDAATGSNSIFFNNTTPTASQFTIGSIAANSYNFIAYLFATVANVSKVGSFSHTSGQTQNIDCGFSSGARFVLVKQYGGTGNWFVYDTARGIVAGNDPRLQLNTTAAENTANDDIDPLSSGFTLTTNFSGGDYIFYAIA